MRKALGFILLLITVASCKQRAFIPEKDMVSILVKIQIIDATTQQNNYRNRYFEKDTIDYYSRTIQAFGYTKAQFDSSLSFYSRTPKELDAIYDKVIIELSKIETKISSLNKDYLDSLERDSIKNLWSLKPQIEFPKDSSLGTVDFSLPVKGLGIYTIAADVCVFDDDKSAAPSMNAYFYFDDKSKDGNRSSFFSEAYSKGPDTINYTIQLDLQNSLVTHLKGSLFNHTNSKQIVSKHAAISNIKVTYKKSQNPKQRNKNKLRRREQGESNLR